MTPPRIIYECPVYDGALKVWRVLNLSSGTVYSVHHQTIEAAFRSIQEGEARGDGVVRGVSLADLRTALGG